jgi:hypothetical protein
MVDQQCWQPHGLVRAVDLPESLWRKLVAHAAAVAVHCDDCVTIVGAVPRVGGAGREWTHLLCRRACRFEHPGSVVAVPDTLIIEMCAGDDGEIPETVIEPVHGGRSAWLYRLP